MPSIVISDTSCLIILDKIGELEILHQTYESILTTSTVASEFGLPLPPWIVVRDAIDRASETSFAQRVDRGEASAIALALELSGATLIIDDQKARKLAEGLGIQVTGTLGVLVRAKLSGVIPQMRSLLDKMRQTNFRFSEEVESSALAEAGE